MAGRTGRQGNRNQQNGDNENQHGRNRNGNFNDQQNGNNRDNRGRNGNDNFNDRRQNSPNGNDRNGNRNGNGRPTCNSCGRTGHVEEDCWDRSSDNDGDTEMGGVHDRPQKTHQAKPRCTVCGRRGHSEQECSSTRPAERHDRQQNVQKPSENEDARLAKWAPLFDKDMRKYVLAQEKQRMANIHHDFEFYMRGHIKIHSQTNLPYDKAWELYSECNYDEARAIQYCNDLATRQARKLVQEFKSHGIKDFPMEAALDMVAKTLKSTHWNEERYLDILKTQVIRRAVNLEDEGVARSILGLHKGDVHATVTGIRKTVQNFAEANGCESDVALNFLHQSGFSELNAVKGYRNALVPQFAEETGLDEKSAAGFLEQSKWIVSAARLEYRTSLLVKFQEQTGLSTAAGLTFFRDLLRANDYHLRRCLDGFTDAVAAEIGWNRESTAQLIQKCGGNLALIEEEWRKTPVTARHLVE